MTRVKLTQVRSKIGTSENQRKNLIALGIRKINQTVEHDASPIIMGMVTKVRHLLTVEMIESEAAAKKTKAPKKAVAAEEAKAE